MRWRGSCSGRPAGSATSSSGAKLSSADGVLVGVDLRAAHAELARRARRLWA